MVCGEAFNSCERNGTLLPTVGLAILGTLLALTILFQLYNLSKRFRGRGRRLGGHGSGHSPVSNSEEMVTRTGDDNSVVDLELEEEDYHGRSSSSSSRHRRQAVTTARS